jgi:hypothetical protein
MGDRMMGSRPCCEWPIIFVVIQKRSIPSSYYYLREQKPDWKELSSLPLGVFSPWGEYSHYWPKIGVMKCLVLILFSLLLTACGQSDKEKIESGLKHARQLLTLRKCDDALTVLNEIGFQAGNAPYLQTYSSAYACKSNYSTVTFFGTDIDKLSASQGGMLGSLTTFTTSQNPNALSASYNYLQTAIETLLYAGGITASSHTNRLTKFTASEVSNMGVQAIYMILVQMGRYFAYYGDADTSTGVKGDGAEPNTCLVTYTNPLAIDALDDGVSGSCTDVANLGHTSIETGDADIRRTRMCHGVVLFNNFIDLITNVSFSGSSTGELGDLATVFDTLCSSDLNVPGAICTIRDQSACEALDPDEIELFFAWIFERIFL